MILKRLRLKNVRTYVDSGWINFDRGTISIIGENWAGKSTLIHSLGHVIFHHDAEIRRERVSLPDGSECSFSKRNFLLRRGASSGDIGAILDIDGDEFRVSTKITSTGETWELSKNGKPLTTSGNRNEVEDIMCDRIGIKETYRGSISDYFEHIVCVMQGEITQPFMLSRQQRVDYFDNILGISSYREAEQNARHIETFFGAQMGALSERIQFLEGLIEPLPRRMDELVELEKGLAELKLSLSEAERVLREVGREKRKMDESEKNIKEMESVIKRIEGMIGGQEKVLQNLEDDLRRVKNAKEMAEMLREVAKRYEETERRLEEIRESLRNAQKLIRKEQEMKGELKKSILEKSNLERVVEEIKTDFEDLTDYAKVEKEAGKFNGLQKSVEVLRDEISRLCERERNTRKSIENLEKGGCPYTGKPCPESENIKKELSMTLSKTSRGTLMLRENERAIKEKMKIVNEAVLRAETLREKRREIFRKLKNIGIEPDQIPESIRKSLEWTLEKRERGIEDEKGRIEDIEQEIREIERKGATDENEMSLKRILESLKKDYENFRMFKQEADKIHGIEKKISNERGILAEYKKDEYKKGEEVDKIKQEYDPEMHERIKIDYERKRDDVNKRKWEVNELEKQIWSKGKEIEDLEKKEEELKKIQSEYKEVGEDLAFFKLIRAGFKKLSEMRSIYASRISRIANKHWKNLTGQLYDLVWDDNYLIYKKKGDEIITVFEMSGGEEISATISIRLGLQEFVGGPGIFILDEPTIYLDAERCENLAKQIMSIHGLDQIIVISHDDTFDAHTDQHIRVEKMNGVSKVTSI
jgi:exonuclease SbcC